MALWKRPQTGLRDVQMEPAAARCGWCGGEVYAGEAVYRPEEGLIICQDCIEPYAKTYFGPVQSLEEWEESCENSHYDQNRPSSHRFTATDDGCETPPFHRGSISFLRGMGD